MDLSISNVITVSVSETPTGVGAYNTSNLAIFTRDTAGGSFGSLGYKIYLEPSEVATDFGSDSKTYKMALAVFSQQPNILAGGGYLVVIPFVGAETLDVAITRTKDLVQYFGLMQSDNLATITETVLVDASAVVQTLNKMLFVVSNTEADIQSGGMIDDLRVAGKSHTRALFYKDATALNGILMMASYAGRALSVNFSGSNTTQTMHLKDLIGVLPDPGMTQTILGEAQAAGADCYVSIQGVPKVFCSAANTYFDSVYNLLWFAGAIEVAGFNWLAQSSTKIPQTELGMDGLKSAYRQVCEQAVSNQYSAPGTWTSATTFGNQGDFLANISQRGYYIYSMPIAKQSAADRVARKAPLVQIALKEAGAIHSASIIVNINA